MDNINYSRESSSYFNNIFHKVITVLGILIEMAIRAAVKIVKIALNLSGFIPSASDNS